MLETEQKLLLGIGMYPLRLPSGLVLELKNCYCVPALNKNIISYSCLEDDGYDFVIKKNIVLFLCKACSMEVVPL